MTIGVIGAGASGMMAALTAAEKPGRRVVLIERQARVGRKLAATGNGRCNLSNANISPASYHGGNKDFILPALSFLSTADTLSLFESMGLLTTVEDSGRIYPHSDTAGSIVDILRFAVQSRGVELMCGCEISSVRRSGGGFTLEYDGGSLFTDKLIIACGGLAGQKLGGSMSGYHLLESLGHTRTALHPSLVQLKTDGGITRPLKGVRADAAVRLICGKKTVASSAGEVQFTDYGVSGPAIFEISRAASEYPSCTLSLDLLRRWDSGEIAHMLLSRAGSAPFLTMDDLFTGMLQNRLGRTLIRAAGYSSSAALDTLSEGDARHLAGFSKNFTLNVIGPLGFDGAQVTAGGMHTEEFDPDTMESRLCPGLYAVGEVLDVDGDCGGFNLQWAWSSGRLAGSCV